MDATRGQRKDMIRAQKLGMRLSALRQKSGLSQEQVAQAAGIATYSYRKLEHGESNPGRPGNPRLSTLAALSEVFGIKTSDLVDGIDE